MGRLMINQTSLNIMSQNKASEESLELYKEAKFISEISKDNITLAVEISSINEDGDYSCMVISEISYNGFITVLKTKLVK